MDFRKPLRRVEEQTRSGGGLRIGLLIQMVAHAKQIESSAPPRAGQPEGLPEISRGLRSSATIPPVAVASEPDPERVAEWRGWNPGGEFPNPFRVVNSGGCCPGVSRRSTPGYHLTSLRDVWKTGCDDGKWIFESIFAALKDKIVPTAA